MNRENIKKVRDVIAKLPATRFDMTVWAYDQAAGHDARDADDVLHNCDTAACIGGWTMAVISPHQKLFNASAAETALGLSSDEGAALFMPPDYHSEGDYSRAHAVRVLDHLLETGEVDWKSTRRPKKATA